MIRTLKVLLFGRPIGVLSLRNDGFAEFEYFDAFCRSGLQPSPLQMPAVPGTVYSFPSLNRDSFSGLPGMISDSLPDSFGRSLLDRWLAETGRSEANILEVLSYQGKRCMGALEFEPSRETSLEESSTLEIDSLVKTARDILASKESFRTNLQEKSQAVLDIIRIGTSAGGQRAKAIIALNDTTGEIRSGQVEAPEGFDYWLLKLDGFDSNGRPMKASNFGRREYAFSECVSAGGMNMTECRLMEENERAHFMTKRFDRYQGKKIHMQTLCGLAHYDFRRPQAYSYEQAFVTMRRLGLDYRDSEELFRRMVFNVMSVNMDDHTKNISFLMDESGKWRLSPAYDMGFSYNPNGRWANAHQMTINGKKDHITGADLIEFANKQGIRNPQKLIEEAEYGISRFPAFAKDCGVPEEEINYIMTFVGQKIKECNQYGLHS